MLFFCPKEGRSERERVSWSLGAWTEHSAPNPSHLVCLAPKHNLNALWFKNVSSVPIQRSLLGASAWSDAHSSASFPLGQALPGADDLLFDGLVTRSSCPGILRVHQAGPTLHRHIHFDLEKVCHSPGFQPWQLLAHISQGLYLPMGHRGTLGREPGKNW